MPELPEVETVRRALENRVIGKRISRFIALRDDYVCAGLERAASLKDRVFLSIERRGKILAAHLSDDWAILFHLGMSGRLLLVRRDEDLIRHTHLRIPLVDGTDELRQWDPRRFGYAAILKKDEFNDFAPWINLGIDPFELKFPELVALLEGRKQPIKSFLLDQRRIAGVGNIYADESLHRTGVHPLRPAGEIQRDEAKRLLRNIRQVLRESIAAGGSTTHDFQTLDGSLGEFQHKHRVYRRTGEPCRTCGKAIERRVISGRGAHFCANCQR